MRRDDRTLQAWVLAALGFFGLVIIYFLGAKLLRRPPARPAAAAAPAPALDPDPAASPLPTAAVRMEIKRIEPRKYRREGDTPPPAVR